MLAAFTWKYARVVFNYNEIKIVNKELVISVSEEEVQIALLEDKNLVELHKEKSVRKAVVGDVLVGQVHKIMPGLNAAFIP